MEDRRQNPQPAALPAALVKQAREQLETEIKLIEGWLSELEEASQDNAQALASRKSYRDMIQSRKDLLQNLDKHPIQD